MTKIDWNQLGFDIVQTNGFLKYTWKDGEWDDGVVCHDSTLTVPIYASALHYGQACFEGLKAFTGKDGKIRIFRPELNAERMIKSCQAVSMPFPPKDLFVNACKRVVQMNTEYVPPYGCNGSMYLRPFVFGSGPVLGLVPASEYVFIVVGNPVGDYYKGGLSPCKALIQYGFDRAAPCGTGQVKLAGNYGPVLSKTAEAKEKGYTVNLFLDPKTGTYVEEFATSNFAALTKPDENGKRTYVTPHSKSILSSITNRSLTELANLSFGWKVERRRVAWSEVMDHKFAEIAACGTAVVITPINVIDREIVDENSIVEPKTDIQTMWNDEHENVEVRMERYESNSDFSGFRALFELYRNIQNGDSDDKFNWMYPAEGIPRQ